MKAVRFLKKHAPFNAGEVAGFPDAQADFLCSTGEAAPVIPDSVPATPEPIAEPKQAEPDVDKQVTPVRRKRGRPRKSERMTTK